MKSVQIDVLILPMVIGCAFLFAQPVHAVPDISATATTGANTLDLGGTGIASTHIVKVADITLSTVNLTGLELTITYGPLTEEENRSIPFQITTVADNAAAPSSSAFTSGDYVYRTDLLGVEARDVYIQYAPNALEDPGNYSAVIQLSVTDNSL